MTSFLEFAKICSRIEEISSSLEMTSMVAGFFKEVSDDELPIVTRFIMGHVFPVWSKEELGIGPNPYTLLYQKLHRCLSNA